MSWKKPLTCRAGRCQRRLWGNRVVCYVLFYGVLSTGWYFHTQMVQHGFFYYLPECYSLSEDIQEYYWQSLLMACSRYTQWYISY